MDGFVASRIYSMHRYFHGNLLLSIILHDEVSKVQRGICWLRNTGLYTCLLIISPTLNIDYRLLCSREEPYILE